MVNQTGLWSGAVSMRNRQEYWCRGGEDFGLALEGRAQLKQVPYRWHVAYM